MQLLKHNTDLLAQSSSAEPEVHVQILLSMAVQPNQPRHTHHVQAANKPADCVLIAKPDHAQTSLLCTCQTIAVPWPYV